MTRTCVTSTGGAVVLVERSRAPHRLRRLTTVDLRPKAPGGGAGRVHRPLPSSPAASESRSAAGGWKRCGVGPKVFGKAVPGIPIALAVVDFGAELAEGHTWQRAALSSGVSLVAGVGAVVVVGPVCGLGGVATFGVAAVARPFGIMKLLVVADWRESGCKADVRDMGYGCQPNENDDRVPQGE